MTNYLQISTEALLYDIKATSGQAFRSHSVHQEGQYCVETTHVEGPYEYHIGFTQYSDQRSFVGFTKTANSYGMYQYFENGTSIRSTYLGFSAVQGQTYLVCLDIENKKYYVLQSGISMSGNIVESKEMSEWYVYYEVGVTENEEITHVLVNLGDTKFNNTIKEGFSPWNYGISGLQGLSNNEKEVTCYYDASIIYTAVLYHLMTA